MNKTNAMRILDARKISYTIHSYDNEDGLIHGTAVAEKIGLPPEVVFKTLVAHSGPQPYVYVIPVVEEAGSEESRQSRRSEED